MTSSGEVVSLLEACAECVRSGSGDAQRWVDQWLSQHEALVWPVMMQALQSQQVDYNIRYFLLVCLCRRMRLYGVPGSGVGIQEIIGAMVEHVQRYAADGAVQDPLVKQAILALALTTVKADAASTEDCVMHMSKALQGGQLVEYMAGVAENAVLASGDSKNVLSGQRHAMLDLCSLALAQGSLDALAVRCVCVWVTSSLLEMSELCSTPLWENLCGMLNVNRPDEADAIVDMLEWLVEHYRSQVPFEDAVPGLENPMLIGPLTAALHIGRADFLMACNSPDADSNILPVVRCVAAVCDMLGTHVFEPLYSGLLEMLLAASGHRNLFITATALECWPAIHRRTCKTTDPTARRAAYLALLHNLIQIARKPNSDEVDEEEWVRVREQVVAEVLPIVYLEVRSELLQVLVEEFGRVLATTDFDEACRGVEGCVFCIRTMSFYLVKRASLADAPPAVTLTASRANLKLTESPEEVRQDAVLATQYINQIVQGLFQLPEAVLAAPEVANSVLNLHGKLAQWFAKAASDELVRAVFLFILRSLPVPATIVVASDAFRVFASRCASRMAEPTILQEIYTIWRTVAQMDPATFDQHVPEGRPEHTGDVSDENSMHPLIQAKQNIVNGVNRMAYQLDNSFEVFQQLQAPVIENLQGVLFQLQQAQNNASLQLRAAQEISVLATIIRAVRTPLNAMAGEAGQHPAVALFGACSEQLKQISQAVASPIVAAAILELCTVVTTCVLPILDTDMILDINSYTLSLVEPLRTTAFESTCDFATEFLNMFGGTADWVSVAELATPQQAQTYDLAESSQQDKIYWEQCNMLLTMCADTALAPTRAFRSSNVFEFMAPWFFCTSAAITSCTCTVVHSQWFDATIRMAVQSLAEQDAKLIRNAVLLLTSLVNSPTTIGGVGTDSLIQAKTTTVKWALVETKIKSLLSELSPDMVPRTTVLLLGVCPELLLDPISSLLYALAAQLARDVVEILRRELGLITATARNLGGVNITAEVEERLLRMIDAVASNRYSASPERSSIPKSRFQDFAQQLWRVCGGKAGPDSLDTFLSK